MSSSKEFDKPRIRLPAERHVEAKKIKLQWHPELLLWTPTTGIEIEIEFEIFGANKQRNGELHWETDLVKPSYIPHGYIIPTGSTSPRESKNLREALRAQLKREEGMEDVRIIAPDVIDYEAQN
jgi:hypothetical protein